MYFSLISGMIIGGMAVYGIILSRCVVDFMQEIKED